MPSIYFLRHSKAAPNVDDRKRELTSEGIALAQARRESLGSPKFAMVIHSDRVRTEQTARIVAGISAETPTVTVTQLMTSHADTWGVKIDAAYADLGNAPLGDFMKVVESELDAFCKIAFDALMYHVKQSNGDILIVGHGIITQAICRFLCWSDENFLTDILDECQGYELEFNSEFEDANLVRHIK